MLQAMNTGHEGSLTTIHANDTRDALARLELMVAMAALELPIDVVRQYIAAGIKLVVHLARLKGGVRRVLRVTEIIGLNGGQYRLKDVFEFQQEALDESGVAQGRFAATGYVPRCIARFEDAGVLADKRWFKSR
jgi:pilus assembly protein CpaF